MLWCAGKIANRLVSDDMFSEKVAANIERNIPQRLQNEGGITASAATQFHRGNFIVVLVSIEQIDLRKMLQSKLDEKKMKRFDQIMHYLEFFPSWVKVDLQNLILQEAGLLHSSKVLRVFSLDQSFACIHWPYIYIYTYTTGQLFWIRRDPKGRNFKKLDLSHDFWTLSSLNDKMAYIILVPVWFGSRIMFGRASILFN